MGDEKVAESDEKVIYYYDITGKFCRKYLDYLKD